MKAYFDTNVLVAASIADHPHHVPAFEVIKAAKEGTFQGCVSVQGLAEFYSVLTRAPFNPRVHPADAGRLLEENILPYFELVVPSADDYKTILGTCVRAGLIGGVVFDALHLHCAEKAGCDRIYTFNLRDFRSLASSEVAGKIASP